MLDMVSLPAFSFLCIPFHCTRIVIRVNSDKGEVMIICFFFFFEWGYLPNEGTIIIWFHFVMVVII